MLGSLLTEHRPRLLSATEIEERCERVINLLQSGDPTKILVGETLAIETLPTAPYNVLLRRTLALHYASIGDVDNFATQLAVCVDMEAVNEELLLNHPAWRGTLSEEVFAAKVAEIVAKQRGRVRDAKDLDFDCLHPIVDEFAGSLTWSDRHNETMEALYLGLLEHADRMHDLIFPDDAPSDCEVTMRSDMMVSPFDLGERFVGPFCYLGMVHATLRSFAPYLEDIRLVMKTQTGPDHELWVVDGVFYSFTHAAWFEDEEEVDRALTTARLIPKSDPIGRYVCERVSFSTYFDLRHIQDEEAPDPGVLRRIERQIELLSVLGEPEPRLQALMQLTRGDTAAAEATLTGLLSDEPNLAVPLKEDADHMWSRGRKESATWLYGFLIDKQRILPQAQMNECAKRLFEQDALRRPPTVPEDAEWSVDDSEWILGAKNEAGGYEGEVRYWRPNGTLVSITPHQDGKPEGEAIRFHDNGDIAVTAPFVGGKMHGTYRLLACDEPTSEPTYANGMAKVIKRVELAYEYGRPRVWRFFLKDGQEVDRTGKPLRPRPASVPENAIYEEYREYWCTGEWDELGRMDGEMRFYRDDGTLMATETCRANVVHGPAQHFDENGQVRERRQYVDGVWSGLFEQYRRDGSLARRGIIEADTWNGLVEDFDSEGQPLRQQHITPLQDAPEHDETDKTDQEVLAQLKDEEIDFEKLPKPSPRVLNRLIGIGWGGGPERNRVRARGARRLVKKLAAERPALARALEATGMDRTPRLFTEARLTRLKHALDDVGCVDADSLYEAFELESDPRKSPGVVGIAIRQAAATLRTLKRWSDDSYLELDHLELQKLPDEVRHLPMLTDIDAGYNQITELGDAVSYVALLRSLDLSRNRLRELPESLAHLSRLRRLQLAYNQFETLPPVVASIQDLVSLGMGFNQLTEISERIAECTRLDHLWLNNNPLTTLPSVFCKLTSLRFLHLGGVAWKQPPDCLWGLEDLNTLWLASHSLEVLPAEVSELKNLTALMLWHSAVKELPATLFEMTHLKELRISSNPLPDGTMDRLKEALPDCKIY